MLTISDPQSWLKEPIGPFDPKKPSSFGWVNFEILSPGDVTADGEIIQPGGVFVQAGAAWVSCEQADRAAYYGWTRMGELQAAGGVTLVKIFRDWRI